MTSFPFYCYIDGYHNDPTLYHFESNKYTYDLIRKEQFPKICYAYLEIFDAKNTHHPDLITSSNSLLETIDCKIDNCDVFVDLGANCGLSSYFAYLQGAKKIFAFEPSPKECKAYLMNNIPNTILYQMAVSDKIGFIELNSAWDLNNNMQDDKYQKRMKSLSMCVTLDYLFEQKVVDKIDFLKVDVEGHEYNIFNGISDDNLTKVKNISLEIHGAKNFNDPKLGDMFKSILIERLEKNFYFDGSMYHKRKIFYLFRNSNEAFLYSSI